MTSEPTSTVDAFAAARDPVTADYLARCADSASTLRTAVADADYPPAYRAYWSDRHLARPLFVDHGEAMRCADDVLRLFDLLTSLPDRLCDGDVWRYCALLGMEERKAAALERLRRVPTTRYGRADLYHDGERFRLLEFNIASDLGGIERSEMQRALLGVDVFERFAREHGLRYVDAGASLAAALRAAATPLTASPTVAMVCADADLPAYQRHVTAKAEMLRRHDLEVLVAGLSDVARRSRRLTVAGIVVDVVLRYFNVDHFRDDEHSAAVITDIMRAHDDGDVVLFTTMDSSLFSNKGALALLGDERWSSAFTADERALVRRLLPWTRLLDSERADVDGEDVDLFAYCAAHRDQLILKPRSDFGGVGIIVGWETPQEEWEAELARCRAAGYVVQRRVVPRHDPVVDPTTGAVEPWIVAWGMLLTPGGYAGLDGRALPADTGAVVNLARDRRTRVSGVFTYPSGRLPQR